MPIPTRRIILRPIPPALAIFLVVAALAACERAEGGGESAVAAVRDSAGVAIVDNERGAWTDETAWRISPNPTLDIGVEEGAPAYQLDRVRHALRLGDGRIVVANGGTQELRFYDASGRHLHSTGGKGGGPGEYQVLEALRLLPGDSLLAYDAILWRLSWLDPRGRFVRSMNVDDGTGASTSFVDRLADGTLLFSRSEKRYGSRPPQGLVRDTVTYLRVDPGTGKRDALATYAGREDVVSFRAQGDRMMLSMMQLPYLRQAMAVASGGGFVVGVSDGYTLERRRADGALERIVRRRYRPVPVEGAYLDSLRRFRARTMGDGAARALADAPRPGPLPAFTRLLEDAEGNLWVETFAWPGDVEPRWEVFDAEGRLLGPVTLPPRFRLTQAGRDFVLGVWRDDVDVQHVQLFTLEKP